MIRLVLVLSLLLAAPARPQPFPVAERHMVAAPHALAAEAGLAVLRDGGAAVDAAVAVQAVLGLVEPHASGLGGGALMLHWDAAARRLSAWDGREVAPDAATPGLFLRPDGRPMGFHEAAVGGRAVGVPGALRMLEAAHREHGRLPWAALFVPAIALAEEGFAVSPRLAAVIANEAERLGHDPVARALFLLPDGSPLPVGHRFRNPALAATLRAVAERGADALHRGPIAAAIADAVRTNPNPGGMTVEDLAGYAPARREALCAPYRVFTVCGFPPPTSGGVATLQILAFLSHRDMPALSPRRPGHGPVQALDAALLLGEAGRLAFADRNRFLADPDKVPVPVRGLLDPAYLLARAQSLDRDRASVEPPRAGNPPWGPSAPPASQPPQPENGTSHISVVDGHGNAVALTTTVEDAFGARLVVGGMVLNNQLTDFSFLPEVDGRPVANAVAPGKRPRSSMSPTIVFGADGAPVLVLGSAGGSRIIGHVAQTLVAMLDWGLDPQEAVSLPRIGGRDAVVEVEAETAAAATLVDGLRARGAPAEARPNVSGLHAIRIGRGPAGSGRRRLLGGADPRREGVAVGD
jgi:gamma-glutamyltranspeptidase/glutathione hydrolase